MRAEANTLKLKIFRTVGQHMLEYYFDQWASTTPGLEVEDLKMGRDGVEMVLFVLYRGDL